MSSETETEGFRKIIRPGTVPTAGGRRASVYCKIEYQNGRLTISGVIGPLKSGNALGSCGQIEMGFKHRNDQDDNGRYHYLTRANDFNFAPGWSRNKWYDLLDAWHAWHLNDLQSACEHQRALGWTYETHSGQDCPVCGYRIGSAWLKPEVPDDVLDFLRSLPDTDKQPAWI